MRLISIPAYSCHNDTSLDLLELELSRRCFWQLFIWDKVGLAVLRPLVRALLIRR